MIAREKGFALIDAMLGVFVLSIGMVAVMDAFSTASKSLDNARKTLIANILAQSKMDEYNAVPSTYISTVACCKSFNASDEFATTEGDYSGYTYELAKSSEVAGYVDRLVLKVHYKVYGKDKTLTYEMLKGLR